MSDTLAKKAQSATDPLLAMNEQQLFNELGARLHTVAGDPMSGGNFALEAAVSEGPFEDGLDFSAIGKQFFDNLSLTAYNLICGGDGNADVKTLLTQSTSALAAGVAAVLVAQLGIAAAVAAPFAAIIVKLFFDTTTKTLCQTWKQHLPLQQPAASPSAAAPAGNA